MIPEGSSPWLQVFVTSTLLCRVSLINALCNAKLNAVRHRVSCTIFDTLIQEWFAHFICMIFHDRTETCTSTVFLYGNTARFSALTNIGQIVMFIIYHFHKTHSDPMWIIISLRNARVLTLCPQCNPVLGFPRSSWKVPVILTDFQLYWNFSTNFCKSPQYPILLKPLSNVLWDANQVWLLSYQVRIQVIFCYPLLCAVIIS